MAYEPIEERIVQMNPDGTVIRYVKGFISSTDKKPMTGISDRSELFERDTGKWFLFNEKKKQWIIPDDTAAIKEEVDEWLEDNIAQETGYVLDSSLTMANAAAPADKVGELMVIVPGEGTDSAVLVNSAYPNTNTGNHGSVCLGASCSVSGDDGAFAAGQYSTASANVSLAIGNYAQATNTSAIAIGGRVTGQALGPVASAASAVAIGASTVASGNFSTSVGYLSEASGQGAIALGMQCTSSATGSVALGRQTVASGGSSISGGRYCEAKATGSGAFGYRVLANGASSFVIGQSNIEDANPEDTTHGTGARKYLFIIGNGDKDGNARSNALTVDWDGNEKISGSLTIGNTTLTEANLQALLALLS